MSSSQRYGINSPNVIQETIDGEAVLINLVSGRYYSLEKAGAVIWNLVELRATVDEMVERIASQYDAAGIDVKDVVTQFLEQLKEEDLIVPDQSQKSEISEETFAIFETDEIKTGKLSFEVPVLHKYTDMEDLLLLDPIHEVDDEGWPVAKPGILENE